MLDSFFTLLQGPTNKAFEVLVEFNFNGSALSQSSVFYLDDYQHTIDVESAEQTAFKSIAKKIGDVANEIRDFRRLLEPLTTFADATGKTKEAIEYFQRIKNEYPKSNQAADIDKHLAKLGVIE